LRSSDRWNAGISEQRRRSPLDVGNNSFLQAESVLA
jgi:hypothetical protein